MKRRGDIRVVQYGLGPIGVECARAVLETPGFVLVGAVDIDPRKIGRSVGDLLAEAAGRSMRSKPAPRPGSQVRVAASLHEALGSTKAVRRADVVLHTTQSALSKVFPQLRECVERGLSVVSSTEELAMPWSTAPALAKRLDRIARGCGAAVLGTGVNPGFVMDVLPVVAAATSRNVRSVRVERVLDAGSRRASFQRKVGVGLNPAEAVRQLRRGGFGHQGLMESALLLCAGCHLHPTTFREVSHPVIASRAMKSAFGPVKKGQVAGLRQCITGRRGGKTIVRLEVVMALGVSGPHDAAFIDADPPVHLRLEGGLPGDTATIGALLNAIPRVLAAPPGLHTALDLPLPRPIAARR